MIGGFIALCLVLGHHLTFRSPKNLEKYEDEFVEKYKMINRKKIIPLTFKPEERDFFLDFCKRYVWSRTLKKYPAESQVHYLDFEKNTYFPFRVQMIRCSEKTAIIESVHYHCVYVLRKSKKVRNYYGQGGKKDKKFPGLTFKIYTKFCYDKEESLQPTNSDLQKCTLLTDRENEDQMHAMARQLHLNPDDNEFESPSTSDNEEEDLLYDPEEQYRRTYEARYEYDESPSSDEEVLYRPEVEYRGPHEPPSQAYERQRTRLRHEPRNLPSSHIETYRHRIDDHQAQDDVSISEIEDGGVRPSDFRE